MCRNIRTLFNFEPPATEIEIRDAALQFVRKLSGFTVPSRANEAAFDRAVEDVAAAARSLISSLVTTAEPRDRAVEAARAQGPLGRPIRPGNADRRAQTGLKREIGDEARPSLPCNPRFAGADCTRPPHDMCKNDGGTLGENDEDCPDAAFARRAAGRCRQRRRASRRTTTSSAGCRAAGRSSARSGRSRSNGWRRAARPCSAAAAPSRAPKLVGYEFMMIREQGDKYAIEVRPSGKKPVVFTQSTLTDSSVVFENPKHGYPQKIGYRRDGDNAISAWIEGSRNGVSRRFEFPYRQVVCAGSV